MREAVFFLFFFIYTGSCFPDISVKGEECAKPPSCNLTGPKPPCEEEKLVNFLADIQVINPESIVEWAVDNLEPLCGKICGNLKKIDLYLLCCNATNEADLYLSLISGVRTLREKLCTESEFVKRYAIYYPCLHELRNDFEACNGPADWNEDPDRTEMCKAYKNVVDCYYIKSAKVCGYEAAKTFKELMREVIDSVVRTKCSGISRNPYVADPMPESYIKKCQACTVHIPSKTILILIFLIIYEIV